MTVYLLQRVLRMADGKTQIVTPIQAYENRSAAEDGAQLRTQALQQVIGCRLYDEQGDTGVSVTQFLRELGISAYQHVVDPIEVLDGKEILIPTPTIILP